MSAGPTFDIRPPDQVAFVIFSASLTHDTHMQALALSKQYRRCRIYVMTFDLPQLELPPEVIVTVIPAGSKDNKQQLRQCAEGIGLQLALTEGAHIAVLLPLSRDVGSLEPLLRSVLEGGIDLILDSDPQHCDLAILSHRAAFMAGIWAQLPQQCGDKRRNILGHIAAKLGAQAAVQGESASRAPQHWQTRVTPSQARLIAQATDIALRPLPPLKPPPPKSVAVITPYYKESTQMLRRAHDSVLKQGANVRHFMIADGFPNDAVKSWDVTHVALGSSHGDNGNTPRGIGGMLAFAQQFDAVTYLDADNWFADGHISSMLKNQRQTAASVICALRTIVLPDGTVLSQADAEDVDHSHVDTSCMMITRERQFMAHFWSQLPKFCGPVCDRFAWAILANRKGNAWTDKQSVFFESNYSVHFTMAGKSVPDNVHDLSPKALRELSFPSQEWRELFRRGTARNWAW